MFPRVTLQKQPHPEARGEPLENGNMLRTELQRHFPGRGGSCGKRDGLGEAARDHHRKCGVKGEQKPSVSRDESLRLAVTEAEISPRGL